MKATLYENVEDRTPICLEQGGRRIMAMSLAQAKDFQSSLGKAIGAVEKHFRCTALNHVFMGHEFWCDSRGSVKQPDGTYLCKRHAKKAAKEPK